MREELHHLSCARGSRLWLEDRQAETRKRKKDCYKRCARRTGQGVAGIRGVRAGKQMGCSIPQPMANSWLRSGQLQNEAAPVASQPGATCRSPEGSKPLTRQHFSATPRRATPERSVQCSVQGCAAGTGQGTGPGTAAGSQRTCPRTARLGQPHTNPTRDPRCWFRFEHVSCCCFSVVCKGEGTGFLLEITVT